MSDRSAEPLAAPLPGAPGAVAGSRASVPTAPVPGAAAAAVPVAPVTEHERSEREPLGVVFWICLAWVVLNILAAILAGVLPIANPDYESVSAINAGPSAAHLLGTDDLGRDILSRLIYGARVSMVVGFGSIAIGIVLGGALGMVAGFRRGAVDSILNSASYVLLAFPALVAIMAIVAFWGQSEWKITVVIGIASAPLLFRVVRASTLSYSTREFVTAARTVGASDTRILVREILPNILPAAVSFALIGVATVIVLEGSLAFLGLSVQPPIPSWGNMLNESRTYLSQNPYLALFPAMAMFLFLLAINLVGDRLRQHFDVAEAQLWSATGAPAPASYPEATAEGPLLEVEDLHTTFRTPRGPLRAVDGVSFTVERGRTLGIVGESGSGKTVLARSIMGLLRTNNVTQSGKVIFEGRDLVTMAPSELRGLWGARISMVFQDPMSSLNPVMRIGRQITESLRLHLHLDRGEAKSTAISLLTQVGIPSPEERYRAFPGALSGGMRQRVMIAIALACAPRLLLADEPTTGLDVTVQAQILDLLGALQEERHMAVVLVTHDLGVVATRTDEIIVMYAGRVVERAPTRTLFASMAMPYTEALLGSTPRISSPPHTRLHAIEGRPPDLVSPPPGCPFAPRCRYAWFRCHEERPPLVAAESPDHLYACWYPLGDRVGPAHDIPGPVHR